MSTLAHAVTRTLADAILADARAQHGRDCITVEELAWSCGVVLHYCGDVPATLGGDDYVGYNDAPRACPVELPADWTGEPPPVAMVPRREHATRGIAFHMSRRLGLPGLELDAFAALLDPERVVSAGQVN